MFDKSPATPKTISRKSWRAAHEARVVARNEQRLQRNSELADEAMAAITAHNEQIVNDITGEAARAELISFLAQINDIAAHGIAFALQHNGTRRNGARRIRDAMLTEQAQADGVVRVITAAASAVGDPVVELLKKRYTKGM